MEIIQTNKTLRNQTSPKYKFDDQYSILKQSLLLDGYKIEDDIIESLDPNFKLQLFADNSMVSTPVGCTLDGSGRLLVVESHTHFRPDKYEGPETDRILAFTDEDGDGKADKTETYYLGGKHTMSITYAGNNSTLVATRGEIYRLDDKDSDGVADSKTNLIELETEGTYPHNGLCGLVLTSDKTKLYHQDSRSLVGQYRLPLKHRP